MTKKVQPRETNLDASGKFALEPYCGQCSIDLSYLRRTPRQRLETQRRKQMKTLLAMLVALACSGCASSQFNHDYSRSPALETTGYGLPQSPHTF